MQKPENRFSQPQVFFLMAGYIHKIVFKYQIKFALG